MDEKEKTEKKKEKKKYSVSFKTNKKGKHVSWAHNILRSVFLPIYFLFKPFRYYGNYKVKDGACVYVSNHYTLFDMAYLLGTTWEGVHFVAKKEVFEAPVLGKIFRLAKIIPVNRDGNDVRALLDCFKCLKNGEKISIFPEGTRNKTDAEMLPFKHGAAAMAIKTKSPVVPVVLYSKPKLFRCAHVIVGDPIDLSEFYDKKMTEEDTIRADTIIRENMLKLRREHKEYLESKKKKKA